MGKGAALANVINLEAFRQKKLVREEAPRAALPVAVMVPVWVCWVPIWYGP
jgi:hypothetical protein